MADAPAAPPAAGPAAPVAPVNGAAPKADAAQTPEEFLEYVVDGKTERIAKSKALERLRKSDFADKRTQQASEAIKAAKAREAQLQAEADEDKRLAEENEEEWLRKKGRDPEAFAKKYLEKKLREQEMTADQRDAEKHKAEAAALRKQVDANAKKEEAALIEQNQQHAQQWMENSLYKAATAMGVPVGDQPGAAEAFVVIQALVQDAKDAELPYDGEWGNRIIEAAKAQLDGAMPKLETAVLAGLKGKALKERLPKAVWDEVLRYSVEELRGSRGFGRPVTAPPAPAAPKANPYISTAQFDAEARKMRGGVK